MTFLAFLAQSARPVESPRRKMRAAACAQSALKSVMLLPISNGCCIPDEVIALSWVCEEYCMETVNADSFAVCFRGIIVIHLFVLPSITVTALAFLLLCCPVSHTAKKPPRLVGATVSTPAS